MLADPTLPDVPLCRLVDPSLTRQMSEFVLLQVLKYHRGLDVYAAPAARRRAGASSCRRRPRRRASASWAWASWARDAARVLRGHGFTVRGWSRTPKAAGRASPASPARRSWPTFLAGTDILVCLLPLTAATRGILDARLLAQLPAGARLVNVARGAHLVEQPT